MPTIIRRLFCSPRAPRRYFDYIGLLYRWITDNPLWHDSIREMSRHLPPGGATLNVIDAGCGPGNSARQPLEYRPDLRILGLDFSASMLGLAGRAGPRHADCVAWVQGDVTRLPARDNSVDAVTAHSIYYLLADRPAFLREALRVLRPGGRLIMLNPAERPYPAKLLLRAWRSRAAATVLSWHAISRLHDRFTVEQIAAHLTEAGFARVLSERAVDSYGILSRGEKPYPNLSTVERIVQTAARDVADENEDTLQVMDAAQLGEAIRGRFVYVLVRQTPDKPAWAMQPGEPIRWQAAMVSAEGEQPYLLAFTSLSKAVEFMQPAVTSGVLHGINKVAKFDIGVAVRWSADVLINPHFESLRASSHFAFNGVQIDVDPASAISGEE